jgi:cyanate lyase
VVDAVAVRTGRSPVEVAALMYGAAPGDDASLVRLADQLDILEREIRRP